MARDPETIQAEIERARDALAVTVDQLATRANPRRFVEQGKQTVQATLADPKVKIAIGAIGAVVVLAVLRKLFR